MEKDINKKYSQDNKQNTIIRKQNDNKDKIDKYPKRNIDYVF